jgi:TRAP-type C4-dicarboxylate transport system substrate-binding protein
MMFTRNRSGQLAVGLVGLAVVLTACSSAGSSSSGSTSATSGGNSSASTTTVTGPSFTLKLEDYQSTTDPLTIALQQFAKQVKADTGGRISITVYPNGELVSETNAVSSLVSDSADIGIGGDDQFATLMPGIDVASEPGFVTTWDAAQKIQASAAVHSLLADQYSAHGLHFLGLIPDGFTYLITQKPINQPSDLKGVKVRVPGTATASVISALSGTPVTLPLGDVFEALEVHTINGAATTATSFDSFNLYQVAKYVNEIPLNMSWFHFAINKRVWDKMSANEQAVLARDSQEMAVNAGKGEEAGTSKAITILKADGATIVNPPALSAFSGALTSLQQAAIKATGTGTELAGLESTAMTG